jgi:hypothetical protein
MLTPERLAERLFARLVAMYGAQKIGAMWADTDMALVKETWGRALQAYAPASIGDALQALLTSGREWPPTLPEFVSLCQQASIARRYGQDASAFALPPPGAAFTDDETARENVRRLRELLDGAVKRVTLQ